MYSVQQKNDLLGGLVSCLRDDSEIQQIVVFGSFLENEQPQDLDVAIIQDSDEAYLPLALKYRKQTRSISKTIPVDIVPVKLGAEGEFLSEIRKGKVMLANDGLNSCLSEDECEPIDSIYISSNYPVGSVLPDFEPDALICKECLEMIADRAYDAITKEIR